MAQWDNQKLVRNRSRIRLQAVIVYTIVLIKNLIDNKSKHKKTKCYYLFYIVLGLPS